MKSNGKDQGNFALESQTRFSKKGTKTVRVNRGKRSPTLGKKVGEKRKGLGKTKEERFFRSRRAMETTKQARNDWDKLKPPPGGGQAESRSGRGKRFSGQQRMRRFLKDQVFSCKAEPTDGSHKVEWGEPQVIKKVDKAKGGRGGRQIGKRNGVAALGKGKRPARNEDVKELKRCATAKDFGTIKAEDLPSLARGKKRGRKEKAGQTSTKEYPRNKIKSIKGILEGHLKRSRTSKGRRNRA